MGLDLDIICFLVVINIGFRGGLDFVIILVILVYRWGILNYMFVGM